MMLRKVIPARTIADNDTVVVYAPADLLVGAYASAAMGNMTWGKPKVSKPKRNKTRSRMAAQSRKRNRK